LEIRGPNKKIQLTAKENKEKNGQTSTINKILSKVKIMVQYSTPKVSLKSVFTESPINPAPGELTVRVAGLRLVYMVGVSD